MGTRNPTTFFAKRQQRRGSWEITDDDRIILRWPFCKEILEAVKMFEGRSYHKELNHAWSFPITERNKFRFDVLRGQNRFKRWDADYENTVSNFNFIRGDVLFSHQKIMVSHILNVLYGGWGAEMGTGKTLANIEALDLFFENTYSKEDVWYVAPKSAMVSVQAEFRKWDAKGMPDFMTYEGMRKRVETWQGGKPPRAVIFDEGSKLKNYTTKRTQAASHLTRAIRTEWGEEGLVLLQSGTPSPKAPTDWWSLCEVLQPGFLQEGDIHKLTRTLAVGEMRDNPQTGSQYFHVLGYKSGEGSCNSCGRKAEDVVHQEWHQQYHMFEESTNEVGRLHKRMHGLIHIQLKKDCLDLPDKRYEVIRVEPSDETKRAASLIVSNSSRAVEALTLLRELSDGFRYRDVETGNTETCPCCKGSGEELIYMVGDVEVFEPLENAEEVKVTCARCGGEGELAEVKRQTTEYGSPKDDVLRELLDQHEEVGRFVVFGGFKGTIDRVTKICCKEGWHVFRIDSSGQYVLKPDGTPAVLPDIVTKEGLVKDPFQKGYKEFQDTESNIDKMVVVANPGSGSTGLTLTRSPSILFYSNDFNGENRTQAEDRIHRPGMDTNRGATIYDIIHLEQDEIVLKNLKQKRKLELISMGELAENIQIGAKDEERR